MRYRATLRPSLNLYPPQMKIPGYAPDEYLFYAMFQLFYRHLISVHVILHVGLRVELCMQTSL